MEADTPSTWKVRRPSVGSKRAEGWEWQKAKRRQRRANASAIRTGKPDPTLSGVGGLVAFNQFHQREGLGRTLRETFGHLKRGRGVVYPMHAQMQLLIDACVAGASRVYDLEYLAGDALFRHLAGGTVPSIDVLYDDLRRFERKDLRALEALVGEQGIRSVKEGGHRTLTVDIDTTVTPLFGEQEGAVPGLNPRYRGRPSYHPILARIAETDTILGARLRRGDTTLGERDVADIKSWLQRLHEAAPNAIITARVDAGGDGRAMLDALDDSKVLFIVKARLSQKLRNAITATTSWKTVDRDAFGRPTRQVAEITGYTRAEWAGRNYRVIAMRTTERDTGRQVYLWPDLEFSVQAYITNDVEQTEDDLARDYDDRAGIEPLIAELKNGFGIGKVSTSDFDANETAFLIKLLAYNLMRRWVAAEMKPAAQWRAGWIRRACVCIPARLVRSGGRWALRLAPRRMLN